MRPGEGEIEAPLRADCGSAGPGEGRTEVPAGGGNVRPDKRERVRPPDAGRMCPGGGMENRNEKE